jgi:S-disulfanyl-L-cysteine oxidoreductase SoxD
MKMMIVMVVTGAALVAQTERTTWSGVYSEAQAKRGETLYTERCLSCHGDSLGGIDQAPPLTGKDFNADWNDLSVNDLFERIRISMPADNPGTLERQQVADVTAFLLSKDTFPPGETELAADADTLKAIKFVATKP